jgi:hypothetical protein
MGMAEITAVTMVDILSTMPELVPWDPKRLGGEAIDLLVCCAGFEDRSTAVIGALADCSVARLLLVQYPTNPDDNARAVASFSGVRGWPTPVDIRYDRGSFVGTLRRALQGGPAGPRIIVDLSGMASYVIYRVLNTIWDELPEARLALFYAEAGEYAPSRAEWDKFYSTVADPTDNLAMAESYEQSHFQSRGVDFTYESEIFPGCNMGPLATVVVAIPSFSLQRVKSMLAYAEAQYNLRTADVRWFLGQPPDKARNGWRFDAVASLYNVKDHGVGVSTRDFRDALQRLDSLWEQLFADRHIVIANLGSKMQHLGCFLFLRMHRECGLLLCEPDEFIAGNYSAGIGPQWLLDLGRICEMRDLLESRGNLRFSWD